MNNFTDYFKPFFLQAYGVWAGITGLTATIDHFLGILLTFTGIVSLLYATLMYRDKAKFYRDKSDDMKGKGKGKGNVDNT